MGAYHKVLCNEVSSILRLLLWVERWIRGWIRPSYQRGALDQYNYISHVTSYNEEPWYPRATPQPSPSMSPYTHTNPNVKFICRTAAILLRYVALYMLDAQVLFWATESDSERTGSHSPSMVTMTTGYIHELNTYRLLGWAVRAIWRVWPNAEKVKWIQDMKLHLI
jgi:hypothetical protein